MAFANNPRWKTYNGVIMLPKHRYADRCGQVRCTIYTTSRDAVLKALVGRGIRETLNHIITHWPVTRNEYECMISRTRSDVPFIGPMNETPGESRPYKPYVEWL